MKGINIKERLKEPLYTELEIVVDKDAVQEALAVDSWRFSLRSR